MLSLLLHPSGTSIQMTVKTIRLGIARLCSRDSEQVLQIPGNFLKRVVQGSEEFPAAFLEIMYPIASIHLLIQRQLRIEEL